MQKKGVWLIIELNIKKIYTNKIEVLEKNKILHMKSFLKWVREKSFFSKKLFPQNIKDRGYMEEKREIAKDRLEVFEKIKEKEMLGGEHYFEDVENDPPTKTLMPEDVDYLKKKLSSKFKYFSIKRVVGKMLRGYAVEHKIEVVGLENLAKVKGGAVVTTNHFNYFDTAPFLYSLKKAKDKRKFHVVIREGNYQIPGLFGSILRNYATFPLSSNLKTTMNLNKAIDTVLAKGHLLLVYPEQAMWWNYKKPRKYRIGAYRWASRNNVPVIPCFTTMEDMDEFEDNGLPKQKLTYHIGEPIYPDSNLDAKQNAQMMMDKNKEFTISVYEKVYNTKYEIN